MSDMSTTQFSKENRRRLGYHPVASERQRLHFEENRARFMRLFDYLDKYEQLDPGPSRELSLAKTALQEALMWTNAHVACNDVGVAE